MENLRGLERLEYRWLIDDARVPEADLMCVDVADEGKRLNPARHRQTVGSEEFPNQGLLGACDGLLHSAAETQNASISMWMILQSDMNEWRSFCQGKAQAS